MENEDIRKLWFRILPYSLLGLFGLLLFYSQREFVIKWIEILRVSYFKNFPSWIGVWVFCLLLVWGLIFWLEECGGYIFISYPILRLYFKFNPSQIHDNIEITRKIVQTFSNLRKRPLIRRAFNYFCLLGAYLLSMGSLWLAEYLMFERNFSFAFVSAGMIVLYSIIALLIIKGMKRREQ